MPSGRDRQLDGLRAIAVTMVLYAHFLSSDDSYWGHVGVRLFFVLSGFLITRLLLDARASANFQTFPALFSFYVRRTLRIFPPYFAMLGFVWLVDLEQSRGPLLWHALYISNFWYAIQNEWAPWVLVHTWTLSIEEQFYIVWPFLILLAPRHWIVRICVAAIVFSLAYRFYWPLTGTPSVARDLLPPASMDALGAGALLAACRNRGSDWPGWIKRSWLPLGLAFLLLLNLSPAQMTPTLAWLRWIGLEVLPLVPLAVIVGLCADHMKSPIGQLLAWRPLVAYGRISYGVYLYHALVLALVVKAQPWIPITVSEQGLGRFLVAGAATLMLASLSWWAFENPINAFKRHFPYVASKDRAFPRPLAGALERLGRPLQSRQQGGHGATAPSDAASPVVADSRSPTN